MSIAIDKMTVFRLLLKSLSSGGGRYDSAYVMDRVRGWHREQVTAGAKGFCPSSAKVLRQLNELAADGLLVKGPVATGYYGYSWRLTAVGETMRAALLAEEHEKAAQVHQALAAPPAAGGE